MPQREVLFEGLSEEQILALPQEHIERLILLGEPLVFRVGSAEILGSFEIASDHLVVELAQIEGGGEGILISLASLAKRYVKLRKLCGVEWIIHAVTCAKPNLKLRRCSNAGGSSSRTSTELAKPITCWKPIRIPRIVSGILSVKVC